MRLGLSHLNERTLKHGFNDTINPICFCGGDIESINHFFCCCPEYCEARQTFFGNIQSIDKMLLSQNKPSLTHLLFYSDPERNCNVNAFILNWAIVVILSSWRFMDCYLTEARALMFLLFFNSFFIWLCLCFCLFIPFCYLSFVLISQVFVTFYNWFCWLLVLL